MLLLFLFLLRNLATNNCFRRVQDEPVPASQTSARRSISPDASSIFGTPSVINTSQLTNITEPDTEPPVAAPAVALAPTASTQPFFAITASSMMDTLTSLPPPRPRRVPTREEFRQVCRQPYSFSPMQLV